LGEEVVAVKFFTALVEPLKHVSTRRDRQKRYLKALGTLTKVKIILGKYQERTVKVRSLLTNRKCARTAVSAGPLKRLLETNCLLGNVPLRQRGTHSASESWRVSLVPLVFTWTFHLLISCSLTGLWPWSPGCFLPCRPTLSRGFTPLQREGEAPTSDLKMKIENIYTNARFV
jgi:hypothetical protein